MAGYVCPNGHPMPDFFEADCPHCEAKVTYEPMGRGLELYEAICAHRDYWVKANGRNPDNARPADLELWELVGGIDG